MLSRSSAKREFGSNNWLGPLVVFAGIGLMVLFFLMRIVTTEIPQEVPKAPVLQGYDAPTAWPRGALDKALDPADAGRLREAHLEWLLRWPADASGARRELYVFPDARRALAEFESKGGRLLEAPGQAARMTEDGRELWFVRGRMLGHVQTPSGEAAPAAITGIAEGLDGAVVRSFGPKP